MGAKNLKAVAVRGTGAVGVDDMPSLMDDVVCVRRERVLSAEFRWAANEWAPPCSSTP